MTRLARLQRIRDPVHNLIDFGNDDFEGALWRIIETPAFQRLRRIRQLGFSELVYPGATHTRFTHSVGVFHTARRLMEIIKLKFEKQFLYHQHWAQVALAAALLHDVGHGMFSHAFEEVGKELKRKNGLDLKSVRHEHVTGLLIRNGEIADILTEEFGSGFAEDVATLIDRGSPKRIYDPVVSSQFDADRLDYMQRDRLMTGVQSSGIDLTWLLANLETAEVDTGVDREKTGAIETFVLGPKAIYAAETYVLGLFQLYPAVYFHKATRGAEALFKTLMVQLITLVREQSGGKTGLPASHPFIRFASEPERGDNVLRMDDSVFWGALPLLAESEDPLISQYAKRLIERRLLKCVDVRDRIFINHPIARDASLQERKDRDDRVARASEHIKKKIEAWNSSKSEALPRVLIDQTQRDPYKRFQDSKVPLNQIHIRVEGGKIVDVAERSHVVAALEPFHLFRVYIDQLDAEAKAAIDQIINDNSEGEGESQ